MVTRKVKFNISMKEIRIEFEGTQELGQQIQQGVTQALGGLMNAQARLLAARNDTPRVVDAAVLDGAETQFNGQGNPDGTGDKPKQPRQRRSKGGPSIGNLLLGLKHDGYFSQARTSAVVLIHLKDNKGHNLPESTVRTELQRMIQRGDLFRITNGENVYAYKDTPFNEGPRSPSAVEQPAQ